MPEAVLIFTFSPIQPFIAEARRTADLFVASRILVKLAQAAGEAIKQHGTLIYPTAIEEDDVPNKIVVFLPWEKAKIAAEDGKKALLREWESIAAMANRELVKIKPFPDGTWHEIWQRQTAKLWEVYWGAANLDGRSYTDAYKEAERALAGTKRSRAFEAADEHELKDSLSGRREALHTASLNAKEYWTEICKDKEAARKLRPEGRERLDAIGATKRFCKLAQINFPSTSTIAAADFLNKAHPYLLDYRQAVEKLLGDQLYSVRAKDNAWPYDGDLLYMETLTQQRLEDSYGVKVQLTQKLLHETQEKLREVYQKANSKPSPYYAIIVLDGDDMGKKIDNCLKEQNPQESHMDFSKRLREFSSQVSAIVEGHSGYVVYGGGDDVVALAPLMQAFSVAQALSKKFNRATDCTASAGMAIVHHLYPLGKAVQAAREAEREAKKARDKASVCVKVLKRSGTTMTVRSRWQEFSHFFSNVTAFFREEIEEQRAALAGKFAYEVAQSAIAFPESEEMFKAELNRLLKRHCNKEHPMAPNPQEWAENLQGWAANLPHGSQELGRCNRVALPAHSETELSDNKSHELGSWLILARFIAKGGSE